MKCCDIKIGELSRKVSIQQMSNVPDGQGGFTTSWVEVATPYCRIKPKSGSEKVFADKLNAHGLSSLVMRYRTGIDETMRVVYRGDNYQIRSIINIDEADEYLELVIERKIAQ